VSDSIDPALIGRITETGDLVTVTAESIRAFCAAIGEDNPLYTDDRGATLTAPPSFALTFRNGDNFWRYAPNLGRGFDAGKEVEFLAPIRAGDKIAVATELRESYRKTGRSGTMTFVVVRSTLANERGEIVARIDQRYVYRADGDKAGEDP
jgi:acyl dehydratase